LPSYSTIKKFAILSADLSIEAGELTPSMKVKRKVVEQKYKQILDGLYN
jgi:long-chain acyl-CoA synthetase